MVSNDKEKVEGERERDRENLVFIGWVLSAIVGY